MMMMMMMMMLIYGLLCTKKGPIRSYKRKYNNNTFKLKRDKNNVYKNNKFYDLVIRGIEKRRNKIYKYVV